MKKIDAINKFGAKLKKQYLSAGPYTLLEWALTLTGLHFLTEESLSLLHQAAPL